MNQTNPDYFHTILAIAPSTYGIGFAVLEGRDTLVSRGLKATAGKGKNVQSLAGVEALITRYRPGVLVLEDASDEGSLRQPRIRKLVPQIVKLATKHRVQVRLFSREEVMQAFLPDRRGTKHALAESVVRHFPGQLGLKLPPKRKAWMREHYQMGVFAAVALALMLGVEHSE